MNDFKPGDRVWVDDPALAKMRQLMRRYGHDPKPNHHGTVHEVAENRILIYFDSEDGPGQGSSAPYPPGLVHHLTEGGAS